jgi:hypothetical protein
LYSESAFSVYSGYIFSILIARFAVRSLILVLSNLISSPS